MIGFITVLALNAAAIAPPPAGWWRASLQRADGHTIDFNVAMQYKNGKPVWFIRNATEKIQVTGIEQTDDIFETLNKHKPDLVLTDFLLSGQNGGKICQLIKSKKETCHLPVVLISAYPELATSFGSFGFDAFINKPFNIGDLVNVIDNLLE